MTDSDRNRLHDACEGLEISVPLALAGAWWTIAELMRRHPRELRLFETIPIDGGGYHSLAVYRSHEREAPYGGKVVDFNLANGTCHIASHEDDPVFMNWAEVVLAPNRRSHIVEPIERVLGLRPPLNTPSTERSTISYRVFAAFMARAAFAGGSAMSQPTGMFDAHWRITQGYFEGHFQENLYGAFGGLPDLPRPRLDEAGEPAWWSHWQELPVWFADHWFVLEQNVPRAAVDVRNARAWNDSGEHDLMTLFEQLDRSIDHVTTVAMPSSG